MKITKAWLEDRGACNVQVDAFARLYPDGVELSRAALIEAANSGLEVDWLSTRLTIKSLNEEYKRRRASAWSEYVRQEALLYADYERQKAQLLKLSDDEYARQEGPLWTEYERRRASLWNECARQEALFLADALELP
jgi:hypothetical protein